MESTSKTNATFQDPNYWTAFVHWQNETLTLAFSICKSQFNCLTLCNTQLEQTMLMDSWLEDCFLLFNLFVMNCILWRTQYRGMIHYLWSFAYSQNQTKPNLKTKWPEREPKWRQDAIYFRSTSLAQFCSFAAEVHSGNHTKRSRPLWQCALILLELFLVFCVYTRTLYDPKEYLLRRYWRLMEANSDHHYIK